MSQGDVAKRRSDLIAEARNEIDGTRYGPRYAHANEVLATEYEKVGNNHPAIAATMRLAGSLQDAHDVLGRLADELATAERERIALQDKVDRVQALVVSWRDQAERINDPSEGPRNAKRFAVNVCANNLSAALSDEPALDAAVTIALDAGKWKAEHGTE